MNILPKSFYIRPTENVAKELLGKILCREIDGMIYKGKIVEVEAYLGQKDLACHTSKGRTARNEVMFGEPGHAYVYFIYGMYHCLNAVTEKEGNPCAVLIRALEPALDSQRESLTSHNSNINEGEIKKSRNSEIELPVSQFPSYPISKNPLKQIRLPHNLLNGPAKLCREFKIDKRLNGWDLTLGKELWIEDGETISPRKIKKAKRVGVDYAGAWKDRLLRFYIEDSKFVSRK